MDITLPGTSGIEVMRRMLIYKSTARVLIFSMHEETIFATRALQAGAAGYVTSRVRRTYWSRPFTRWLRGTDISARTSLRSSRCANSRATRPKGCPARELEVLRWLAQGHTVKEITVSMGLSPKTVANHQSAIKQKLEADTAIELLRRVNQLGLET